MKQIDTVDIAYIAGSLILIMLSIPGMLLIASAIPT